MRTYEFEVTYETPDNRIVKEVVNAPSNREAENEISIVRGVKVLSSRLA